MSRLPPTLALWEESLSGLSPHVAQAVGPILLVLDDLIGRLDAHGGDTGEPDGYDGTTNRGEYARLLVAEWLLAQEVPDEFLRRAAENELSFLRLARRQEKPAGRVVAIVDTGPEQLGVGRLVQLAALVVLHRRARTVGSELALWLLDSGRLVEGDLDVLLGQWLDARTLASPTAAQVDQAFTVADDDDRLWLLAGPTARRHAPAAHRRTVAGQASAWSDAGVEQVAIQVANSTARLPVPDPPAAVAALRGEGLLRRRSDPALATVPTTGRGATFNSGDTRLLWRGGDARELYACFVTGGGHRANVRQYRMEGDVIAAASLGRRLVAAVTDGNNVWIQVIGKKFARTHRIHVPLRQLDIRAQDLEEILAAPPRPLYLLGGNLMLDLPTGRWVLHDEQAWESHSVRAVAPGTALDNPHQVYEQVGHLSHGSFRWPVGHVAAGPLVGPPHSAMGAWVAWSEDTRVWKVTRGPGIFDQIAVEENDRVLGLSLVNHEPALLVTSPSGRIVRQVFAKHVKTWTRWAGPAHFSVHPTNPWLARTTADRITVGNLGDGSTMLEIRVDE